MSITTVLTNNYSQVVRLPADVRLPESAWKVKAQARGMDRIISPVGQIWNSFFLSGPRVSDDFMTDRAPQEPSRRNSPG